MAGRRHAEIAGAGIGGLAVATALAQRGWSVRVHERASELRELGVGTSIWANGQRILGAIGALDEILRTASPVAKVALLDERQRVLSSENFIDGGSRGLVVLRVEFHRALVNAATRAGVEIVTSSDVVSADPSGELVLESGKRLKADLVIGADGYHSKVRDSLGLAERVGFVTSAWIGRTMVPRTDTDPAGSIREHWSGPRRLGVLTCGARHYYLFLSAPEDAPENHEEVRARRIDKQVWIHAFPHLSEVLERVEDEVRWDRYSLVKCRAWSTGRAGILGDAAHAMPSTLAQGAGCALSNALSLAMRVDRHRDVPSALREWERAERRVTEITQRFAAMYLLLSKRWPPDLVDLRSEVVSEIFRSHEVLDQMTLAARHLVKVE